MSTCDAFSGHVASSIDSHSHVCVLYGSMEEAYRVLRPFISQGFPKGDKAFHIIDGRQRPEHMRRLHEFGIDVGRGLAAGQLEIRGWEDAHLRPGWFDQHAMLSLVDEVLAESKERGFPYTRWVADMGWALTGCEGSEDLVEYCTRLNDVVPRHDATIVCSYDLSRFSAEMIVDVLRTHPAAVIGGTLHENPYYVPSQELLREIRAQREGRAGRIARAAADDAGG